MLVVLVVLSICYFATCHVHFNFNIHEEFKYALKRVKEELTETFTLEKDNQIPGNMVKLVEMTKRLDSLFQDQEDAVKEIENLYKEVIDKFYDEVSKVEDDVTENISKTVFKMKGITSISESERNDRFFNYYYLLNKKSRTSLDMSSESLENSKKNGLRIHGWERVKGNPHQLWKILVDSKEEGYFRIVNMKTKRSLDLEESGGVISYSKNYKVVGTDVNEDSETQLWGIQSYNEKYYHIVNKKFGTVLDINDGLNHNGNLVQSWVLQENNPNQLWKFVLGETVSAEEENIDDEEYEEDEL